MKSIIISLFVIVGYTLLSAQQDHFLVELEARGPEVEDLVKSYEGFPSIPIMAKDVNGVEQNLFKLKDQSKNVVLWFWNLDCPKCHEQIESLNKLQSKYSDGLQVLSFADDSKADLLGSDPFSRVGFPVIPSSKTLADGPYGGDLGYPRIFIIDEYGVIKWVFPQAAMKKDFDAFQVLETLHLQLKK